MGTISSARARQRSARPPPLGAPCEHTRRRPGGHRRRGRRRPRLDRRDLQRPGPRRNGVTNAWSQIDVQLKRRYDLVPNLVETVRGYATHERQTFDSVTAARAAAVAAQGPVEQAKAENALSATLRSLFAVSEAYPQLQASRNFSELQAELSDTENRIAYARQYYNDAVLTYNNACRPCRRTSSPASVASRRGSRSRRPTRSAAPSRSGSDAAMNLAAASSAAAAGPAVIAAACGHRPRRLVRPARAPGRRDPLARAAARDAAATRTGSTPSRPRSSTCSPATGGSARRPPRRPLLDLAARRVVVGRGDRARAVARAAGPGRAAEPQPVRADGATTTSAGWPPRTASSRPARWPRAPGSSASWWKSFTHAVIEEARARGLAQRRWSPLHRTVLSVGGGAPGGARRPRVHAGPAARRRLLLRFARRGLRRLVRARRAHREDERRAGHRPGGRGGRALAGPARAPRRWTLRASSRPRPSPSGAGRSPTPPRSASPRAPS